MAVGAPRTPQESLKRLEAEGWALYLEELRRLERISVDPVEVGKDDWDTPIGQFLRSDPGNPLGPGMPTGSPLGSDDSHLARWEALLRWDPCAYCGKLPDPWLVKWGFEESGTVDHVKPQCRRDRLTYTWVNLTGACASCNSSKRHEPLLLWMRARARMHDRQTRRRAGAAGRMVTVEMGNGASMTADANEPLARVGAAA